MREIHRAKERGQTVFGEATSQHLVLDQELLRSNDLHAQSLAVRGLLIAPAQAATLGLVDEVVPADQVVSRAVDWCEGLVKLPRTAMEFTRRKARADLVGYFQHGTEREIEEVSASWWDEETQTALRQMVNRLAKKKV